MKRFSNLPRQPYSSPWQLKGANQSDRWLLSLSRKEGINLTNQQRAEGMRGHVSNVNVLYCEPTHQNRQPTMPCNRCCGNGAFFAAALYLHPAKMTQASCYTACGEFPPTCHGQTMSHVIKQKLPHRRQVRSAGGG